MNYNCIIVIKKKDKLDYYKLLSIEDLEYSDIGRRSDFINISTITFDNNYNLFIDLVSGDTNYYLQYELIDNKNNVVEYDVLEDFIDFKISDSKEVYNIHFETIESECE